MPRRPAWLHRRAPIHSPSKPCRPRRPCRKPRRPRTRHHPWPHLQRRRERSARRPGYHVRPRTSSAPRQPPMCPCSRRWPPRHRSASRANHGRSTARPESTRSLKRSRHAPHRQHPPPPSPTPADRRRRTQGHGTPNLLFKTWPNHRKTPTKCALPRSCVPRRKPHRVTAPRSPRPCPHQRPAPRPNAAPCASAPSRLKCTRPPSRPRRHPSPWPPRPTPRLRSSRCGAIICGGAEPCRSQPAARPSARSANC